MTIFVVYFIEISLLQIVGVSAELRSTAKQVSIAVPTVSLFNMSFLFQKFKIIKQTEKLLSRFTITILILTYQYPSC